MTDRPLVMISGVGQGLGLSLARQFAGAGYDVAGLARTTTHASVLHEVVAGAGGIYTHHLCDVGVTEQVEAAVAREGRRVDVLVHNAHRLLVGAFAELEPTIFEEVWRVGCFGAMNMARYIVPSMIANGGGTIVFSGATASRRGGAKFAAFASAKFALRGFAQALARELEPQGVHVAHVVLDGLIDAPQTDQRFGATEGTRMNPDAVARAYLALAQQDRSAWSHELDLRPHSEPF